MSNRIVMCNYYGNCDHNGNAVGHSTKVTNEYAQLINTFSELELIASPCIVEGADLSKFIQINTLPYNIEIEGNSIFKRIVDKIKLFININHAIGEKGIHFFYQVDFFFFLYILIFYKRKKDRQIVCLIYHQNFINGYLETYLQKIYENALKKIDGVIYTQKQKEVSHSNAEWIPDYIYDEKKYKKYQEIYKENKVVCVGTMNCYKQLEELVDTFSTMNISLLIAGKFDSRERYNKLLTRKTENIEIQDVNMTYDKYMEVLASAKYSILPYDMQQYHNRTSGVLLESIYAGSIPIAPRELLKQNALHGIEYTCLNELTENTIFNQNKEFSFKNIYNENRKERIQLKLELFFKRISNN